MPALKETARSYIEKGWKIIRLNNFFHECGEEYNQSGYSEKIEPACVHCPFRYKCATRSIQRCLIANKQLQKHYRMEPISHGADPNHLNMSIKREWMESSIKELVDDCESGIKATQEVLNERGIKD